MDNKAVFRSSRVAVNLAQVMAYQRVGSGGVEDVLKGRQGLYVVLADDSDLILDADEDVQGFISAIDAYLEST